MRGNQKTPPLFFAVDKEEGLTLHRIFESHDKPLTPWQLLNTISSYSGSNRLEDSRSNLFSVLAPEGNRLDLPVQTHLDGYHKFRDEGKRNSTETKKLSAKLGKGKRKERRKALVMRQNPEAQTRIDA